MRDAVQKPWEVAVPVFYTARRSASKSLDDAPHRLRLLSCPAGCINDLYESLLTLGGISRNPGPGLREPRRATSPCARIFVTDAQGHRGFRVFKFFRLALGERKVQKLD